MRIIALVTQKGGSGKSTIASSLAVAAAETGETVIVVDMDPQASLTRWAKVREEKNIGVTTFTPGKLASAVAAMEKAGVTTVIIDTPGTDSPASQAAMKVADICIIPARPNVFDLWASESTRKQLRALRREYAFLLNQCPPAQQSARVEQGAKALEAMGGLLNPTIRRPRASVSASPNCIPPAKRRKRSASSGRRSSAASARARPRVARPNPIPSRTAKPGPRPGLFLL